MERVCLVTTLKVIQLKAYYLQLMEMRRTRGSISNHNGPPKISSTQIDLDKDCNITYSNKCSMKVLQDPENHIKDSMSIQNTVFSNGNDFKKVTAIQVGKQMVTIEECFSIQKKKRIEQDSTQQKNLQKCQNKKIEEWDNQDSEENEKSVKKDKKNIVKNVVKLFRAWIKTRNEENNDELQQAQQYLDVLLKTSKFNKRLMNDLIEDKVIQSILDTFLRYFAADLIKQSRIQDKETHYEAVREYRRILKRQLSSKSTLTQTNSSVSTNAATIPEPQKQDE